MSKEKEKTSMRSMLDKVAKNEATPIDVSSLGEGKDNPIYLVPTARGTMIIEKSTGKTWFSRLAKVDEKAGLRVFDAKPMMAGEDLVMEMRMTNSMAAAFAAKVVNEIEDGYEKLGKPDGEAKDK